MRCVEGIVSRGPPASLARAHARQICASAAAGGVRTLIIDRVRTNPATPPPAVSAAIVRAMCALPLVRCRVNESIVPPICLQGCEPPSGHRHARVRPQ